MREYYDEITKKRLLSSYKNPHNIILLGSLGLNLYEEAVEIAESYLNTSALSTHPDFTEINSEEKTIKKDAIDEVLEIASYEASVSKRRVVLINKAERLTESAQNALLKCLEDNSDKVNFILCCDGRLLPTIHSRCETIQIDGLVREAFEPCDEIAYVGSKGVPEYYNAILSDEKLYEILKSIPECILDRKKLLALLNGVKEKDDNFFFSAREPWEISAFMNCLKTGIETGIISKRLETKPKAFGEYEGLSMATLYRLNDVVREFMKREESVLSRNDYFNFLLTLTEEI